MTRLESLAAKISDLPNDGKPDTRLNIGDCRAVSLLCFTFECRPEDIYVAVAMVGDKLQDLRAYLTRALTRDEDKGVAPSMLRIEPLPPLWPTVL